MPLISEKSLKSAQGGWYSFKAPNSCKKSDINNYLKDTFNQAPLAVTSQRKKSVNKKRGKFTFNSKSYKIFRVKLGKDANIPGFETETEKKDKAKKKS